ncbi:MAG: protein-export chaperone SecB [Mariprofundaceae bacterium]|nr:protein-export chaperone SecB [Mariprofundaceae bacterium]
MPDEQVNNEAPILSLQKIYVRDISFENPNAPDIFVAEGLQPNVEMNISVGSKLISDDHWEVSLKINAKMQDKSSDKVLFEVEVEQSALFFIKNVPEDHIRPVLCIECPGIIFPFTRQLISQLTLDGGFMPLLLEPVNFRVLYEANLQAESEQQENSRLQ